jgi:ATP-dependent Lhr-like helicase
MADPQNLPGLDDFHPAVASWFAERFPLGPTPPQVHAWPSIRSGADTLVAAPTGSGKTLAAFLVAIDQLYKAHAGGASTTDQVRVVYVSPLKALAVDISENLETPLAEIAERAVAMGLEAPAITVGVRSGDTTSSQRAAMLKRPPNFLITTPESLYLLLTAAKSREILRTAETLIIDEIHAVARDKRGTHLTLSVERLEHVADQRPVRIGLSATQRPIETVARLLVGTGRNASDGSPLCNIIDTGHQRQLDLAMEIPDSELEAVAPAEQMGEVLDSIAAMVLEHHTTLVFVNTRRMAERIAHQLGERLGDDHVAAHHGSLSKDRRLRVERRLRAGDLRALVATASLELGIDIGPVELVCQIGSPRSLATFLQRVGRSGHSRHGTPKGRLFPLTRDELVESAALLAGVRSGKLDAIEPPIAPLDILAQQLVAETAAQRWNTDELYEFVKGAAPYADLERDAFDETLDFAVNGVTTGRGRRGAYIHHDVVNGEAEGRRGARLAALTSGGAIPELADYRVLADPDETLVGTVNEDWAIESMAGDIFLLGTHSWRIRRVEPGVVRVIDAGGAPPTVPFWLGEAPARTAELSHEVSELRALVNTRLAAGDPDGARAELVELCGIPEPAAEMIVTYMAATRAVLGTVPTADHLVIERFFDESGGMQLVVHSPHGGRINRGFGLALRKRFCKSFDFELQAAANDDAIVLSLGPQHSFPLADVPRYLKAETVEDVLRQAVLVSPMFTARWRWNLNRTLTVLRFKGGRKNPPPIQRMEADDIMAAVFPGLAQCQENAAGPIEIPDHLLVRQTMYDALHEAMDINGLRELIAGIESGAVDVAFCDTTEPSPLAHEILSGRPYTFLDDAPLEERRTRAVPLRRGLPVELDEIGAVDHEAISRVRSEAAPDIRTHDELHDLLASWITTPAIPRWSAQFEELAERGRALSFDHAGQEMWCATERQDLAASLFESAGTRPTDPAVADTAAVEVVRGHLDTLGPVTVADLAGETRLSDSTITIALAALQGEGFAIAGSWSAADADEWCSRRLLSRIHVYSTKRRRRDTAPVTAQDFMTFLLTWQHVAPGSAVAGRAGLTAVIEQLQGYQLPAAAWEPDILRARVRGYEPRWLDELCLGGDVVWGRLGVRSADKGPAAEPSNRSGSGPSRSTPITVATRADIGWLLAAARGESGPLEPTAGATAEIIDELRSSGARFHTELAADTGRLPDDIRVGLWDGVARGLITADSFAAIRALFDSRRKDNRRYQQRRRGLRRGAAGLQRSEGRWAMLPVADEIDEPDELAEAVAEQLLARWGVVFRDLVVRETLGLPWRDILWAFRRLEARGLIRGGRFVTGFVGEQYALPEAVDALKRIRRQERDGQAVTVCAADPLNLTGVIVPGQRTPAVRTKTVTFVDGIPQAPGAGIEHGGLIDETVASPTAL